MITTYTTKAAATCPVDGAIIDYDVSITVASQYIAMLYVEDILSVLARLTEPPTTQEELTSAISQAWPSADIETTGTHSGVRIVCCIRRGGR